MKVRGLRAPVCSMEGHWGSRLGRAGVLVHLELDGKFVGAKYEAGSEKHSALLLSDRFGALPLTPLDFFQKLQDGVRESRSEDRNSWAPTPSPRRVP